MTISKRTYSGAFHYRGVPSIPASVTAAEYIALFAPAKITLKGIEADGFKRASVPFALSYELAEDTPAGAVKAIEYTLHLYAKEFADNYEAVPTVIDWAAVNDWLTTTSTGGAEFSAEQKKAAILALRDFVFKLTDREAVADGLAYVIGKGLSAASLMDAKGFRAKPAQIEGLYKQIAQLIAAFAGDETASAAHSALISKWADVLTAKIEEYAAPSTEIDLLA